MPLTVRLILCACLATVFAADSPVAGPPSLVRNAKSAKGFCPKGWTLERVEKGDLNGDGKPDLAFLCLQQRRDSLAADDPGFLAKYRILGVALAQGKGYRLVVGNRDFLPAMEDPAMDDPVGSISIGHGQLWVSKRFWTSRGSWWTSDEDFVFALQKDCMRLVRYHGSSMHRGMGVITEMSQDLLTGRTSRKVSMVDGAAPIDPSDGDLRDSTWRVEPGAPVCLDTLKEWNPSGP
jgi:hypothetical protein